MTVFVQKAMQMFEVDFREQYEKYICRKWDQLYVIDEIQKDPTYLHNKE